MPEDLTMYIELAATWGLRILGAIAIFVVGWIASKTANRMMVRFVQKRDLDAMLGRFLATLLQWTVLGAAAIAAMGTVGIETTSLVAVFASAGVAIGFALQGSLSNFAAGVMILVFRPFAIDDVITAGGSTGRVIEIGLFATILHTPDGLKIIVPNGAVTSGTIVNITTLGKRRADVPVGVAYGEDPQTVMAILERACASCEAVVADPAPAVAFVGLGDSSIDFMVMGWGASGDYLAALHQIRTACYEALNAEGIDIPYPQVVMHQAEAAAAAK